MKPSQKEANENQPENEAHTELPYDVNAEQNFLSHLLRDNACVDFVCEQVRPEYFYEPQHAQIYRTILGLHQKGKAATPLLIKEQIKKDRLFENEDIEKYLATLTT